MPSFCKAIFPDHCVLVTIKLAFRRKLGAAEFKRDAADAPPKNEFISTSPLLLTLSHLRGHPYVTSTQYGRGSRFAAYLSVDIIHFADREGKGNKKSTTPVDFLSVILPYFFSSLFLAVRSFVCFEM